MVDVSGDQDFKGASEVGKIFNSFLDKKLLCDFFLDSVSTFIPASSSALFLQGRENQLWLETSSGTTPVAGETLRQMAQGALDRGQPKSDAQGIMIPLVVRNSAIGIAAFFHKQSGNLFTDRELSLALDLTYQMAGALQNILLLEQNLKMERLAAIGQTTSMVMHELTNILQLGKLAEECLRRGLDQKQEKYLNRGMKGIQKALREMDGFAYEMLSLTKDYKIKPVSMNLKAMIDELREDLHDKAVQARVRLDFEVEGDLQVEGEARSLYRALLNIVKNAMEASDKSDAYVKVRVRELDGERYVIVLEDNGQGMTEEVKARIFQAFFSTKGQRGTGLGLMIIDRTVRAHGGKIQVDSEAGKGTCFTLTFPKVLPKE